jgi:hypothetical protein
MYVVWKQLFKSSWKDFTGHKLKHILERLDQHANHLHAFDGQEGILDQPETEEHGEQTMVGRQPRLPLRANHFGSRSPSPEDRRARIEQEHLERERRNAPEQRGRPMTEFEGLETSRQYLAHLERLTQEFERLETDRKRLMESDVRQWLCSSDLALLYEDACQARNECPGSGAWILENDMIKQWKDSDIASLPVRLVQFCTCP